MLSRNKWLLAPLAFACLVPMCRAQAEGTQNNPINGARPTQQPAPWSAALERGNELYRVERLMRTRDHRGEVWYWDGYNATVNPELAKDWARRARADGYRTRVLHYRRNSPALVDVNWYPNTWAIRLMPW